MQCYQWNMTTSSSYSCITSLASNALTLLFFLILTTLVAAPSAKAGPNCDRAQEMASEACSSHSLICAPQTMLAAQVCKSESELESGGDGSDQNPSSDSQSDSVTTPDMQTAPQTSTPQFTNRRSDNPNSFTSSDNENGSPQTSIRYANRCVSFGRRSDSGSTGIAVYNKCGAKITVWTTGRDGAGLDFITVSPGVRNWTTICTRLKYACYVAPGQQLCEE